MLYFSTFLQDHLGRLAINEWSMDPKVRSTAILLGWHAVQYTVTNLNEPLVLCPFSCQAHSEQAHCTYRVSAAKSAFDVQLIEKCLVDPTFMYLPYNRTMVSTLSNRVCSFVPLFIYDASYHFPNLCCAGYSVNHMTVLNMEFKSKGQNTGQ